MWEARRAADQRVAKSRTLWLDNSSSYSHLFQPPWKPAEAGGQGSSSFRAKDLRGTSRNTGKGALYFLRSHVMENHELERGQNHHPKEVILK